MIEVRLSWAELRSAAVIGVERHVRAMARQRVARYDQPANVWHDDIVGALGELVVAKATGRYPSLFDGALDYGGDVGRYEVRTTEHDHGCLIVHPHDADRSPFVLVRGTPPVFRVIGWMLGGEAKRDEWWRTDVRHPAYFVPATALSPLDALP